MNVRYCSTASSSHRAARASCPARRQPGASRGAALPVPGGLVPFTRQRALPAAGAPAAGEASLRGPGSLVPFTLRRALPAAGGGREWGARVAAAQGRQPFTLRRALPAAGGGREWGARVAAAQGRQPFTLCWPLIRSLSAGSWIAGRAGGITMRNQLDRAL